MDDEIVKSGDENTPAKFPTADHLYDVVDAASKYTASITPDQYWDAFSHFILEYMDELRAALRRLDPNDTQNSLPTYLEHEAAVLTEAAQYIDDLGVRKNAYLIFSTARNTLATEGYTIPPPSISQDIIDKLRVADAVNVTPRKKEQGKLER